MVNVLPKRRRGRASWRASDRQLVRTWRNRAAGWRPERGNKCAAMSGGRGDSRRAVRRRRRRSAASAARECFRFESTNTARCGWSAGAGVVARFGAQLAGERGMRGRRGNADRRTGVRRNMRSAARARRVGRSACFAGSHASGKRTQKRAGERGQWSTCCRVQLRHPSLARCSAVQHDRQCLHRPGRIDDRAARH